MLYCPALSFSLCSRSCPRWDPKLETKDSGTELLVQKGNYNTIVAAAKAQSLLSPFYVAPDLISRQIGGKILRGFGEIDVGSGWESLSRHILP